MVPKKRRAWKGNDLALLNKLENVLTSLIGRDSRQARHTDVTDNPDLFFKGLSNSGIQAAMTALQNRIDALRDVTI